MSAFIVPMGSLPTVSGVTGAGTAQKTQGTANAGAPFQDFLTDAMQDLAQTGATAQDSMVGLALGDNDDLHTGAIAAAKSRTAITYTTNLVSTAVRAYKELMQMQI